jgi:aryl-alcohol dehydrogenase-like predicted oxidoreductase
LTGKYKRGQAAPAGSRGAESNRMAKYSTDEGFAVIETLERISQTHNARPAQIAIAWLVANPVITSAIIGARTPEQLAETIKGAEISLSETDMAGLNAVSDKMP